MIKRKMGSLEVITGCMFSGKSEELVRRLKRERIAKRKFLAIKPSTDDRRGKATINTYDGQELPAYSLEPEGETLEALAELVGQIELEKADVVGFDEGQFFSDNLFGLCKQLVRMGKRVIVAGLDLSFAEEPFGPMPALMALANPPIDKLTAVCVKCGEEAIRTQRLIDGKPATKDSPLILVGGEEAYEARCLDCYEPPE